MKLDAIDRKILGLLRSNGRIPNNELAAAVGLSASACLRRVRLLEQSGVIQGSCPQPDSTLRMARLELMRLTPGRRERISLWITS